MTKARNIANIASDGSALADGTINYTDVSGTPTLATVATSGAYADVTGTPTLAAVATSGSFNDLSNQPSPFDPNTLATVATTGAYADVTGTPTLATVATSGAYADVTGTPTLATVATTGAYADVTGTPTLGTAAATNATAYATAAQGTLADTATQPGDLAAVATSGAYSSLSGTPAAALPLTGGTLSGTLTLNAALNGVTSVDATTAASITAAGIGGANRVLLQTTNITTNLSYIDYTFPAGYDRFEFEFFNMRTAGTNGRNLVLQFANSGGSLITATNTSYVRRNPADGSLDLTKTSWETAYCFLASSPTGTSWVTTIDFPTRTDANTRGEFWFIATGIYSGSSSTTSQSSYQFMNQVIENNPWVRMFMEYGDQISSNSGSIKIWGYKNV